MSTPAFVQLPTDGVGKKMSTLFDGTEHRSVVVIGGGDAAIVVEPLGTEPGGGTLALPVRLVIPGTPVPVSSSTIALDTSIAAGNASLSTIAGRLPAALGSQGALKIEGVASGTAVPISGTIAATQSGAWSTRAQDGAGNALTSVAAGATRPLHVAVVDGSGTHITSFGSSLNTRADTYTGAASGTTVDTSTGPKARFGLQVKGTGGAPTSWTVVLEGSLNNVNWTTLLTHTNTTHADGATAWTSAAETPCLYFRSRCSAVSLGGATNIVATIVGVP